MISNPHRDGWCSISKNPARDRKQGTKTVKGIAEELGKKERAPRCTLCLYQLTISTGIKSVERTGHDNPPMQVALVYTDDPLARRPVRGVESAHTQRIRLLRHALLDVEHNTLLTLASREEPPSHTRHIYRVMIQHT